MRSKEFIEKLMSNGKHFCVLPWVHLHVTGLGYMSPCCQQLEGPNSIGYGSINESSFHELWQGEAIKSFRLKMLADEMDERCGCRTCCYSSSSSWYKDQKSLGELDSNITNGVINGLKDTEVFLADLEQYYPDVETIYFAGGEPLLFKENLSILEKLDSLKRYDIFLSYNTNFTQINKKK